MTTSVKVDGKKYGVGSKFPTCFSDQEDGMSIVMGISPYHGRYTEDFTHVLRLTAPRTSQGFMDECVKHEA